MKRTILAAALWAAIPAHAEVNLLLGTGMSFGIPDHHGVWYQEDRPHKLDLNSEIASIGVEFRAKNSEVRWGAEFIALGEIFSWAQVVRDAENYPGSPAEPSRVMIGRGSNSGIALTVSKPVAGPVYVTGGLWAYQPKWKISVYDRETGEHLREREVPNVTRYGPTLGVGVRVGSLDVAVQYFGMEQVTPERPSIINKAVALRVRGAF